jgi:hypothetical protein
VFWNPIKTVHLQGFWPKTVYLKCFGTQLKTVYLQGPHYGKDFTHGFDTQNYPKLQASLGTQPENTHGIWRQTQPNPYPWIFSGNTLGYPWVPTLNFYPWVPWVPALIFYPWVPWVPAFSFLS